MKTSILLALLVLAQDSGPSTDERAVRTYFELLRAAAEDSDAEVRERAKKVLSEVERRPLMSREDAHGIFISVPAVKVPAGEWVTALERMARVRVRASESIRDVGDICWESHSNVSLSTFLDRFCRKYRLGWSVRDGAIVIGPGARLPGVPENRRRYDIRWLAEKVSNFPQPQFGLHNFIPAGGGPGVTFTLEEPEEPIVSPDDLITLIMEEVDPLAFLDTEHNDIALTPNLEMLIAAPAATHEKIEAYLGEIHRLVQVQWEGHVWIVAAPSKRAAGVAEGISAGRWGELHQEAVRGGELSMVATARLTGRRGQRVGSVTRRDHPFVSAIDENGKRELRRFAEGTSIDVRAIPERAARMMVELRISLTRLIGIEKIWTPRGDVENPEVAQANFSTTVSIAEGAPTVLTVLPNFRGFGAGQESLVIVLQFSRFTPE
jgi:hypothetical protein